MRLKKKRWLFITLLIVISIGVGWYVVSHSRNNDVKINSEDLVFVLEYDSEKQNDSTDQFIKEYTEKYFLDRNIELTIKEVDYDLRTVSKGKVVIAGDDETDLFSEDSRYTSWESIKGDDTSNTVIKEFEDDTFIGKLITDDDKEIDFEYKVFDTIFPIIESDNEIVLSLNSEKEFRKLVIASDEVDGALEIEIDGEIDWSKPYNQELVVSATDKNGNSTKKEVVLKLVDESEQDENDGVVSNNNANGSNTVTKPNPQEKPQPKPDPKPQPKPDPKPDPKPQEDNSWKRHPKDFLRFDGVKMYFHKNYGAFEGCHAVAEDMLMDIIWNGGNWSSTFCNSTGDLFYSEVD